MNDNYSQLSLFDTYFNDSQENDFKVAVIKLGSRVSVSSTGTSGGTGETLSIINMLTRGGASVDVYTKVLDKDERPVDFNIYNIDDEYYNINSRNYSALLILNGNVNYFGGVDSPSQTLNYWIINNFKGRVYYIMCDCNLLLKQIWPSIERKAWATNYNKDDIQIIRDDITYISQAMFTDLVKDKAEKALGVKLKSVIYYPTEKFPLLSTPKIEFNPNTKYDLLYGGTFRGGKRESDMIKFYFGLSNEFNVEMFGKIGLDNFSSEKILNLNQPKFGQSVNYSDFGLKMNQANATIIIGDPLYKQWGDLAQRIYESIMVNNVVLIDSSYDFSSRVFNNNELKDFNYVSNRLDVEDRLRKLKDVEFRKHITELQLNDINIDLDKYCKDFVELFKEE